jgi:polysaccharide chain length determinant protein (PEP-CTERM system associated)
LTAQPNRSRLELREGENSRDALKKELAGEEPVLLPEDSNTSPMVSGVPVPELDGRLEALKKALDGLTQRYTDLHPDVIVVKRQIKELEDQKLQVLAARRKASQASPDGKKGGSSLQGNPVYLQLRVSLAETEASIAQLKTRVAEYEARLAKLKETAKLAPQLEAEYTQLNRDYGVHKRNYETLVSRREQAEISGDMENVSGADFRLIDPPRVSPQPVAPNRLRRISCRC